MSDLAVGQTVWIFDSNHRQYTKAAPGRIWGDLIWRGHFRPVKIEGETSRSWLLSGDLKADKKTLHAKRPGFASHVYTTPQEIDDACFVNDERHKIAEDVRRCYRVDTLKQIRALLSDAEGQP